MLLRRGGAYAWRVAEDLKPVYLLTGRDRPKIARALARLRARFPAEAIEHLSADETSGADVAAACNAMGLFAADGRLVIVDAVDGRPTGEGRLVGGWRADDVKAVAEYLRDPAPATVLALVGEEAKRDSPLAKACAKVGELLVYDVAKRDLPRWVAEQFARLGAKADDAAARALVELVGDGLDELEIEIEKIVTWAGGAEIREADVQTLAAGRAETSHFALSDAWGRRDVSAVLSAKEGVLERTHPRGKAIPALVWRLAGHVGRVAACQELEAEGVRARDAAGRLKMHPFAAEKAFAQARNFSVDELRNVVVRLARLDVALKGGSRLPDELELDRALVDVTRSPEPAERGRRG